MAKVSVIIPVYGVEQYIERCARSLFEQTLDDIEYLFIDDCTPDSSIQILKRVLADYPNRVPLVKIIKMDKNSGQAAVRTKGISLATGDYIIHCDSDDWVDRNMYEQMYSTAEKEKSDCVICGYMRSDGILNLESVIEESANNLFDDILSHKVSYSLWNKMYSIRTFNRNSFLPPKGNMGEDMIINLQLANNVTKTTVIKEPLYFYFENASSICLTPSKESAINRYTQSIRNVPVLLEFFRASNLYDKYKTTIVCLIANKRVWLIPYLNDKECYKLWRSAYPGINNYLLFNIHVPIKEKIRFVLNYLRIKV